MLRASAFGARLFRTSIFRLTLIYAGLFGASVALLFAVINYSTAGFMARELDRSIADEASALQDEARMGGSNRLAALIAERQSAAPWSGMAYLLQDAVGERLAGKLKPLPAPVIGWFDLPAEGDVQPHRIHALGTRQASGNYLVVGQDAGQLDQVQALILDAFLSSAGVTFVLAIGSGLLFSASLLRRVAAVARTSQAIMAGDLSRRMPDRRVGDEFDQLAEVLNGMLARIETLMAGLKQVTNDVAHDLRTPLSRLRQRLEAVQRETPSIAEYEALVERSIGEIDAMLETFAAMLRIAEIEAASRTTGFRAVDLAELLSTVVEVYEPMAAEREQQVAAKIGALSAVPGDRELLTQLVANLVQNAIVHTPPGSRIDVMAEAVPGAVEVVVADSGPGIPEAERDKVFRRFYRLEASRTRPGSGLGLSLVSAIAALHRIELTLGDNHPGLRVMLRIPAEPP